MNTKASHILKIKTAILAIFNVSSLYMGEDGPEVFTNGETVTLLLELANDFKSIGGEVLHES